MRGTFFLAELLLICLALWLAANILHYIMKMLANSDDRHSGFFSLSNMWMGKPKDKGKK